MPIGTSAGGEQSAQRDRRLKEQIYAESVEDPVSDPFASLVSTYRVVRSPTPMDMVHNPIAKGP